MIPVSAAARRPKGRLRENSRDVIREIARRTGMSRDIAKKYLRAREEMPRYAKHASSSKFDPNAATLATWLASVTRSRKQRCVQRILGRMPKLTNARA
jgi:transposase